MRGAVGGFRLVRIPHYRRAALGAGADFKPMAGRNVEGLAGTDYRAPHVFDGRVSRSRVFWHIPKEAIHNLHGAVVSMVRIARSAAQIAGALWFVPPIAYPHSVVYFRQRCDAFVSHFSPPKKF